MRDGIIDARQESRDAIADLERDFARQEASDLRDHKRELEQIRKSADAAESDAVRQRNFLALAETRDEAVEARQEAQEEFVAEGEERKAEAEEQRRDIVQEAERTTRDLQRESQRQNRDAQIQLNRQIQAAKQRLSFEQQALNQSLLLTQQWANQFQNIFANLQLPNGATGQPQQATSASGLNDIFAPQRFGA